MPKAKGEPASPPDPTCVCYDVVALSITIYFNREGDHDHNGMIFALCENLPILKYIKALAEGGRPAKDDDHHGKHVDSLEKLRTKACERARKIGVELPTTPQQAKQPHPLVRPLVLRARRGEQVKVRLHNQIRERAVGLHLVGGGYDVRKSDGSDVACNPASLATATSTSHCSADDRTYTWACEHEGVFPFHDGGHYSGDENGTNVHGLFGALIVEPPNSTWRDPTTGVASHGPDGHGPFVQLDGLYLDVLREGQRSEDMPEEGRPLDGYEWPSPTEYTCFDKKAYREFVIFFHDEPEFLPPHGALEPNPCGGDTGHGGGGDTAHGGGGEHGHDNLPIMPISYRAEPMINRERTLWRLLRTGHVLEHPVLNEEQHHSSWMFGDPVTPILRAYIGDPVRIRLVHAGVKETHVFHLHLYEWHAVPQDPKSPRIDAISISPQTGHTIEPLWGAGNRHQVAGDIIWHCHLYPHFHEGMWGMFRTFETQQNGQDGSPLESKDDVYAGRRIGRYPDGSRIDRLLPLPDREALPIARPEQPGYPLYIPGTVRQKSPRPPWPDRELADEEKACNASFGQQFELPCSVTSLLGADMPLDFDYRPVPTDLERNAFNELPVPAEMFTRNRMAKQQQQEWTKNPVFRRNSSTQVCHDVVVAQRRIEYNSHGWHDKHGHLFYLEADGNPDERRGPLEPLFFRAQHGQIVNTILRNDTPKTIPETEFDHAFPPCPALPWEGECALHVHMVKFDPICADGASVGWNYLSGARHGRRMAYRWWADQEFGTIFFHDHLFANYRQKHGLFGALLVEPAGARFFHHVEPQRSIVSGLQAVIERHCDDDARPQWFREFCIGIGDFIPAWNRHNNALNPPPQPGGHGDAGVMGLNYRNAPIRERDGDPAGWFSSRIHGDPDTTIFKTYADDPVWIRLVQGSHEESHSFQIHALRWRRFRDQICSATRNQQTTGIAEAFTFINQAPFGIGDYLYKLSAADDLWLGCWGLIRALERPPSNWRPDLFTPKIGTHHETNGETTLTPSQPLPPPVKQRCFKIRARATNLLYRDDIIDPHALVYEVVNNFDQKCPCIIPTDPQASEPVVIWCREGEEVVVELQNCLPETLEIEPGAPEVPVERDDRPVSSHVSLHADLVTYDVREHDGANVGHNPLQTVPPGQIRTYRWNTSQPGGKSGPLGPILLQDMADFRNHRHHGLVGALVVLPADATPYPVAPGQATAQQQKEQWHGTRMTVKRNNGNVTEEMVLLMQDGLRLFLNANGRPGFPLPDPPQEEPGEAEQEDQGQKAFNYRTEPIGPIFDPRGSDYTLDREPATPIWYVPVQHQVRFHLVCASDKPRAHSFTIHGVAWPEHQYLAATASQNIPMVSSEAAISSGTVRTFEFTPTHKGDHAYRNGVLKWALPQGMWGVLRVVDKPVSSSLTKQAKLSL